MDSKIHRHIFTDKYSRAQQRLTAHILSSADELTSTTDGECAKKRKIVPPKRFQNYNVRSKHSNTDSSSGDDLHKITPIPIKSCKF